MKTSPTMNYITAMTVRCLALLVVDPDQVTEGPVPRAPSRMGQSPGAIARARFVLPPVAEVVAVVDHRVHPARWARDDPGAARRGDDPALASLAVRRVLTFPPAGSPGRHERSSNRSPQSSHRMTLRSATLRDARTMLGSSHVQVSFRLVVLGAAGVLGLRPMLSPPWSSPSSWPPGHPGAGPSGGSQPPARPAGPCTRPG